MTDAPRRTAPAHAVQPVIPADLPAAGSTLARAFLSDPVWQWLTGPRHALFETRAARYFSAETRHHIHLGSAWTTEGTHGVALWAPPNRWKFTLATIAGLTPASLGLFGTRLPKALSALGGVEKHHPTEPHWYLAMLGTDPDQQGKGVGSALLRPVLDRCDRDGLPAYLESSKETNVPFYERHGFTVTDTYDLPGGGPRLWLMWREPVPPIA